MRTLIERNSFYLKNGAIRTRRKFTVKALLSPLEGACLSPLGRGACLLLDLPEGGLVEREDYSQNQGYRKI